MLSTLLWLIAAAVIGFLVYVALQPSTFRVVRTGVISAAPGIVFQHVNDLHKWQAWSPWARLDPKAKGTFDGPEAGPGAAFTWAGNKNVGEGTMTILESNPNERIRMRLDFRKPMTGTNITDFTFKPAGGGTEMTWDMSGQNNFISRLICSFMSMDKMVGGQFEQGMANLNEVIKAGR